MGLLLPQSLLLNLWADVRINFTSCWLVLILEIPLSSSSFFFSSQHQRNSYPFFLVSHFSCLIYDSFWTRRQILRFRQRELAPLIEVNRDWFELWVRLREILCSLKKGRIDFKLIAVNSELRVHWFELVAVNKIFPFFPYLF